jgi:hypothetical protein
LTAKFLRKPHPANERKDIVSKDILKRIANDMARVLLHLEVDRAEIVG